MYRTLDLFGEMSVAPCRATACVPVHLPIPNLRASLFSRPFVIQPSTNNTDKTPFLPQLHHGRQSRPVGPPIATLPTRHTVPRHSDCHAIIATNSFADNEPNDGSAKSEPEQLPNCGSLPACV